MPEITIIMGSISDKPVADKATAILEKLEVTYELRVSSAHRTPGKTVDIIERSDADVFIAIAGLAAHLPGVVAAHTTKPVIAVPCKGALEGLDTKNDENWTVDGLPRMEAICAAMNDDTVTREEVEAVIPGFTRQG